jgi:hypothetical protein
MTANPEFQDRIAGGVRHALALRLAYNYANARDRAKTFGADVSDLPALSTRDLSELYCKLVGEWVVETPDTARAARAFLDLAAEIAIDELAVDARDIGPIVSRDEDLHHLIKLLAGASGWMIGAENREYLDRNPALAAGGDAS